MSDSAYLYMPKNRHGYICRSIYAHGIYRYADLHMRGISVYANPGIYRLADLNMRRISVYAGLYMPGIYGFADQGKTNKKKEGSLFLKFILSKFSGKLSEIFRKPKNFSRFARINVYLHHIRSFQAQNSTKNDYLGRPENVDLDPLKGTFVKTLSYVCLMLAYCY